MAVVNNPNPQTDDGAEHHRSAGRESAERDHVRITAIRWRRSGRPRTVRVPAAALARGSGGGVGSGKGGGFGPGEGGGVGGGVFRVGGGVTAPSLLYKKEPEYSEEARKAKYQGTVLLDVEVDPTRQGESICSVLHSLGLGLDEKAMEAVKQWKFKPGLRTASP